VKCVSLLVRSHHLGELTEPSSPDSEESIFFATPVVTVHHPIWNTVQGNELFDRGGKRSRLSMKLFYFLSNCNCKKAMDFRFVTRAGAIGTGGYDIASLVWDNDPEAANGNKWPIIESPLHIKSEKTEIRSKLLNLYCASFAVSRDSWNSPHGNHRSKSRRKSRNIAWIGVILHRCICSQCVMDNTQAGLL
jgi:hypothetical protein